MASSRRRESTYRLPDPSYPLAAMPPRPSSPSPSAQSGSGQIGMAAAVSIGIGGMVGAGIFSILGVVAQAAGNAMWLAFAIGGVVALLSTYSYAKLGATFPSAGGAVHFLVQGLWRRRLRRRPQPVHVGRLHHLAGALCDGIRQLRGDLHHRHAVGPAAQIAGDRLGAAGDAGQRVRRQSHGAGRDDHRRHQGWRSSSCSRRRVCGSSSRRTSRPRCGRHAQSILFGAGVLFIGYEGFGLITNAAGDMRDPRRMLPRALYTAVILVIVLYLAVSVTVTGNLSNAEIERAKDYAMAEAAKPFLGEIGFRLDRHRRAVLDGLGHQCHAVRLGQRLLHDRPRRRAAGRTVADRMEAGDRRPPAHRGARRAGDAVFRPVRHRHDGKRRIPPRLRRGQRRPSARPQADRRERH